MIMKMMMIMMIVRLSMMKMVVSYYTLGYWLGEKKAGVSCTLFVSVFVL